MNWRYGNPIVNGEYLCCIKGYPSPISFDWYDGKWGSWDWIDDKLNPIDQSLVVCYIGFDEIPMPEGW